MKMRTICCYTILVSTMKTKNLQKNGYLAYNKLKILNVKIPKLSDKLKDMYGITVVTNNSQCAEPPNTIVKCVDLNRKPIQKCTSDYQMKLRTVSSALIIGTRKFAVEMG